jgi:hypothetical protein
LSNDRQVCGVREGSAKGEPGAWGGKWGRRYTTRQTCATCAAENVAHHEGVPHYLHRRGARHLAAVRAATAARASAVTG